MDAVSRLDRRMRARPAAPAVWMTGGMFLFAVGAALILLVPRVAALYMEYVPEAAAFPLAYGQAALATMFGIVFLMCGILGWRQHDAIQNPPDSTGSLRAAGKSMLALTATVILPGVGVTAINPSAMDYWEFGGPVAAAMFLAMLFLFRMARPAERPAKPLPV